MFKCQKTVNNIPIGSLKHSTKTTEKPGTPNAPKLYSVSIRENSTQYGNRRKKKPNTINQQSLKPLLSGDVPAAHITQS